MTTSGFRRGRPTLPATGRACRSSSNGSSWVTSLRLPPVSATASGMPVASTKRWCFEPVRERSTGDGPVRSPPKGALRGFEWLSSEREVDRDAAAAEVDEGDQWGGGVKAEAAVADQADAAVEALEAAVGEPEADRGEDAVAVRAEGAGGLDER